MSRARLNLRELTVRLQTGPLSEIELEALRADPRVTARRLAEKAVRMAEARATEIARLDRLLAHERPLWRRGVGLVAGVDEVGAGPLAGPVLAAAVILLAEQTIAGVDDSKKLTHRQRERLAARIREMAVAFAFGSCSPEEIDEINIYQASRLAMQRAVLALAVRPDYLLVDARVVPRVPMPQQAIKGGDRRSHSIAAASIIAKVERDALMLRLAQQYPGYGFEKHRGYGTRAHMEALTRLGPSPIHRKSFGPVAQAAVAVSG